MKRYNDLQRNELLRVDKNFDLQKLIDLIISLNGKIYEDSEELKMKQEETKQMQLNLELKKIELEILKIEVNRQTHQRIVREPRVIKEDQLIKNYFNENTMRTSSYLDTIKMTDLYSKFMEYLRVNHPTIDNVPQRTFTTYLKNLKEVNYNKSIYNLGSTSGITHRKFRNL